MTNLFPGQVYRLTINVIVSVATTSILLLLQLHSILLMSALVLSLSPWAHTSAVCCYTVLIIVHSHKSFIGQKIITLNRLTKVYLHVCMCLGIVQQSFLVDHSTTPYASVSAVPCWFGTSTCGAFHQDRYVHYVFSHCTLCVHFRRVTDVHLMTHVTDVLSFKFWSFPMWWT